VVNISVAIGEVTTDITTDVNLTFDDIETLLKRASESTLNAYNHYFVSMEEYEKSVEDDD
jgi:hypothetical protein